MRRGSRRPARAAPGPARVFEERGGETPAAGVAGDEQLRDRPPVVEQRLEDRHRVLEAGRERKLRRKAVVHDEQVAADRAHELCGEHRVHPRGGRQVATAVEVQDGGAGSTLRADPDPGDPTDLAVRHRDAVARRDRAEHRAAEVVEHLLERSQPRRRKGERVAEQGLDDLANALVHRVVHHRLGTVPRLVQRKCRQCPRHAGAELGQRDRGFRRRRGFHSRSVGHDHAGQPDSSSPAMRRNSLVVLAWGNGASGSGRASAAQIGPHPSPGCHSTRRSGGMVVRTSLL